MFTASVIREWSSASQPSMAAKHAPFRSHEWSLISVSWNVRKHSCRHDSMILADKVNALEVRSTSNPRMSTEDTMPDFTTMPALTASGLIGTELA